MTSRLISQRTISYNTEIALYYTECKSGIYAELRLILI